MNLLKNLCFDGFYKPLTLLFIAYQLFMVNKSFGQSERVQPTLATLDTVSSIKLPRFEWGLGFGGGIFGDIRDLSSASSAPLGSFQAFGNVRFHLLPHFNIVAGGDLTYNSANLNYTLAEDTDGNLAERSDLAGVSDSRITWLEVGVPVHLELAYPIPKSPATTVYGRVGAKPSLIWAAQNTFVENDEVEREGLSEVNTTSLRAETIVGLSFSRRPSFVKSVEVGLSQMVTPFFDVSQTADLDRKPYTVFLRLGF